MALTLDITIHFKMLSQIPHRFLSMAMGTPPIPSFCSRSGMVNAEKIKEKKTGVYLY
jgi:hypothetical protein